MVVSLVPDSGPPGAHAGSWGTQGRGPPPGPSSGGEWGSRRPGGLEKVAMSFEDRITPLLGVVSSTRTPSDAWSVAPAETLPVWLP